jgi:hypothetical protein
MCAVALILPAAAGCSVGSGPEVGHSRTATVHVGKTVALADEPVYTRISGLGSGEEVTVTATATDKKGMAWTGRAVFDADGKGVVDLDHAKPKAGTYHGVDGMGLFWSMTPAKGDPDSTWFLTNDPRKVPSYQVRLAVEAGSRTIAVARLTRMWVVSGVHRKKLSAAHDKLSGELFLPLRAGRGARRSCSSAARKAVSLPRYRRDCWPPVAIPPWPCATSPAPDGPRIWCASPWSTSPPPPACCAPSHRPIPGISR